MKTIGTIFVMFILFVMHSDSGAEGGGINGLKAVAGDSAVYLSWSKSGKNTNGYLVYRAMSKGNYQRINPTVVMRNFYKDSHVVNGQTYWYKVSAFDNAENEDLLSEEINATPAYTNKSLSGY